VCTFSYKLAPAKDSKDAFDIINDKVFDEKQLNEENSGMSFELIKEKNRWVSAKESISSPTEERKTDSNYIPFNDKGFQDPLNGLLPTIDELDDYIMRSKSADQEEQLKGIVGIRKILSGDAYLPLDKVVDSGILPWIMDLMNNSNIPQVRYETAWIITNCASGNSTIVNYIVKLGAIDGFISLLSSNNMHLAGEATWGLGNLAADSISCRDSILNRGGFELIVKFLEKLSTNSSYFSQGIWALLNMCGVRPCPPIERIECSLPLFVRALNESDNNTAINEALRALSYISQGDEISIQNILDAGIMPHLLKALKYLIVHFELTNRSEDKSVLQSAVKILINISAGSDNQTHVSISYSDSLII